MKKLATIIGARPQFIKAATVSRAMEHFNAKGGASLSEVIIHTGQHYDSNMSDVFFREMSIPRPHYFLDIHGLSHGAMTGQMLESIEKALEKEKPDAVLVYGDTNTTLAGALAAVKLHIPVAHVESGLRSFNRSMPEEINRVVADHVSTWLFCPTKTAVRNLENEGIKNSENSPRVLLIGDVMYDAALFYAGQASQKARVRKKLGMDGDFALCTIHRAENTDDPKRIVSIFSALESIARQRPVIMPLHPRTRKKLGAADYDINVPRSGLHIIEPVGYFDMLDLLTHARLVLTDSGGLQKEAYFFRKPCVTLRDETEWVELLDSGANVLAGADREKIVAAFEKMSEGGFDFSQPLYGDGHAAGAIVRLLASS